MVSKFVVGRRYPLHVLPTNSRVEFGVNVPGDTTPTLYIGEPTIVFPESTRLSLVGVGDCVVEWKGPLETTRIEDLRRYKEADHVFLPSHAPNGMVFFSFLRMALAKQIRFHTSNAITAVVLFPSCMHIEFLNVIEPLFWKKFCVFVCI